MLALTVAMPGLRPMTVALSRFRTDIADWTPFWREDGLNGFGINDAGAARLDRHHAHRLRWIGLRTGRGGGAHQLTGLCFLLRTGAIIGPDSVLPSE